MFTQPLMDGIIILYDYEMRVITLILFISAYQKGWKTSRNFLI